MSVTKTVTQDQRKVRLGGARASTVAFGWVSRKELCLWKGMGAGHALHMTVREIRHMTRQLPEVPDEAADEQPRRPVAAPDSCGLCDDDHFLAPAPAQAPFLST